MKHTRWLVLIVTGVIAAFLLVRGASANGAPVTIFLNYLPELSNYGPTTASGEAQVSIGEAWVDITAQGMPQLEGVQYEAWLVTADNETMISLGTFNSDVDGNVAYHAEFDDIPLLEYRYLVISVEPVPDDTPTVADSRRTIAGVFPNTRLEIVSGTATPTLGPGITATPGAPGGLPVTGNVDVPMAAALWLGLGAVVLALGVTLLKRR
jgi:hypothetical protein